MKKTCLEGNTVTPDEIGNYLHYIINFENIGTETAQNVVVKDIVDLTKFDINSLQVMNSSNPVDIRITGNVVEFIFQNINLPSSIINPIGGHGNVLFKIKTLPTLTAGTMVSNTANIYFDYNYPIKTNEARTTFSLLSNAIFKTDATIAISPNPTNDKVTVKANNNILSLQLFDAQGRILQTANANNKQTVLDISAQQNGILLFEDYD